MINKFKTKKDIIIPAGSIFTNVDNESRKYVEGNYETEIGLSKDTAQTFKLNDDYINENPEMFEIVKTV